MVSFGWVMHYSIERKKREKLLSYQSGITHGNKRKQKISYMIYFTIVDQNL